MKYTVELIYAEILSLAENISYLKGRCDSVIELCSISRYCKKNKKMSKYDNELYHIEQSLINIKNKMEELTEQVSGKLIKNAIEYKSNNLDLKYQIIETMQNVCK